MVQPKLEMDDYLMQSLFRMVQIVFIDGCSNAVENVQLAVTPLCLDYESSQLAILVVLSHRDFAS